MAWKYLKFYDIIKFPQVTGANGFMDQTFKTRQEAVAALSAELKSTREFLGLSQEALGIKAGHMMIHALGESFNRQRRPWFNRELDAVDQANRERLIKLYGDPQAALTEATIALAEEVIKDAEERLKGIYTSRLRRRFEGFSTGALVEALEDPARAGVLLGAMAEGTLKVQPHGKLAWKFKESDIVGDAVLLSLLELGYQQDHALERQREPLVPQVETFPWLIHKVFADTYREMTARMEPGQPYQQEEGWQPSSPELAELPDRLDRLKETWRAAARPQKEWDIDANIAAGKARKEAAKNKPLHTSQQSASIVITMSSKKTPQTEAEHVLQRFAEGQGIAVGDINLAAVSRSLEASKNGKSQQAKTGLLAAAVASFNGDDRSVVDRKSIHRLRTALDDVEKRKPGTAEALVAASEELGPGFLLLVANQQPKELPPALQKLAGLARKEGDGQRQKTIAELAGLREKCIEALYQSGKTLK